MKCSKTAIDNIMFRKAVTNKMKRSRTTKKNCQNGIVDKHFNYQPLPPQNKLNREMSKKFQQKNLTRNKIE